jgi:hypothetical protein
VLRLTAEIKALQDASQLSASVQLEELQSLVQAQAGKMEALERLGCLQRDLESKDVSHFR